ncbi:MAG: hypothetical protein ACK5WZ_00160, partial [Pseudobdellovibrionaceae bacterium]
LGVLGLVANKISQDDEIPVFVAGKNEEGLFVGSARLPEKMSGSLLDVLNFCSKELIRFGGHSHAAGFMFSETMMDALHEKLRMFFTMQKFMEREITLQPVAAQLTQFFEADFIRDLDLLEPFGKGFEAFLFEVRKLRVLSIQTIKEKHLKLMITNESSRVTIIGWLFSATKAQIEFLKVAFEQEKLVNVYTQVQMNEFRGKLELQLLIKKIS